jgi:ATP-binding cassette subfamily C (CFTR/MRP) protein 1
MNKLNHVRNDLELNTLRKIGATQSFANFTWYASLTSSLMNLPLISF